jgi:6-phosphogluconolactonase
MGLPGRTVVADDLDEAFAELVVASFRARTADTFSVALTGTDTARRCYERLAAAAGSRIDWWKVDVYWSDERCIPHDHEASHYRVVREALLDRVGAANATHLMRGAEGPDPYQLRLGDLGRIDLVHLDLAPDGSVGSLFPGSEALQADPGRLVALNDDPTGRAEHQRMTLTPAGIARAVDAIVTVSADAADALAAVARGDDVPGAALAEAPVTWLVERAAADAAGVSAGG